MTNPILKLAGQTAIYGLSSIIGRLLNYILVPLYTLKFANPADYGVVSELYAWVAFLIVILAFGMETAYFRFTQDNHDEKKVNYLVSKNNQLNGRGIEVGHIFSFGDKYSNPMKASISGSDGKISDVFMGSYGIGVSRLVAAIIETSNDEKGIIWPTSVAPFLVDIINLKN